MRAWRLPSCSTIPGRWVRAGIDALKRASHALVNAVEGGRGENQDIRISLVPFVTAVNIKGEGL